MRADLQQAYDIAKKKKRLFSPVIGKGTYEYIDKLLLDDEEVVYLAIVNIGIITRSESLNIKPFDIKNKTPGVLTITSKRILHCWKFFVETRMEQIAFENINNIETKGSMVFSLLRIQSMTNIMEIDFPHNFGKVDELSKMILELMDKAKKKTSEPIAPAPQEDPMQKLKKLKEMLDAELITPQEFEAKKSEILSKM